MPGGADRFLAFLTDELKPWVQERYAVTFNDSMFFGDSRGGLFATYVLLTSLQLSGAGIREPVALSRPHCEVDV